VAGGETSVLHGYFAHQLPCKFMPYELRPSSLVSARLNMIFVQDQIILSLSESLTECGNHFNRVMTCAALHLQRLTEPSKGGMGHIPPDEDCINEIFLI
jgi:hypothetical protein